MNSPFLYLVACSTKNRILARLRRLREPRYLVGAVVGVAYFYLIFFRQSGRRSRRGAAAAGFGLPAAAVAPLQLAGALLVWVIVLVRWFVPVSRQPLQFTGPERDLLLTAPLARRRIIRYKLLRSQVGIFLSTAVMLVFTWRSVNSPWSFLLGMFRVFTTLRLHLLGVALSRESLLGGDWRRAPAAVLALAIVIIAGIGIAWAATPAIAAAVQGAADEPVANWQPAFTVIREQARRPAIALALLPFATLVRPVLASWPVGFAKAVLPVVGLVLLNYLWVLHADGTLEHSTAAGERDTIEGQRAPVKPSYRRAPFSLAASGRAEWALVWKNLILLGRYASPAVLLRIALPVIVLAVALGTSGRGRAASSIYPIAMAIAGGLTVLGPYSFRNDLRQDIARLDVLKAWPISGERLLWGEVLAPSVTVAVLVWLLIFVTGALSLAVPSSSVSWAGRLAIGFAALVVTPAVILAQVVIQNAAVVLFPGWVAVGPARARGVEAMGQQMLMFAGTLLLLAVGVLPGVAISAAIAVVGYVAIGWAALVPAAVLLSALLLAETFVAIHFLGAVLERTDPTAVERGA